MSIASWCLVLSAAVAGPRDGQNLRRAEAELAMGRSIGLLAVTGLQQTTLRCTGGDSAGEPNIFKLLLLRARGCQQAGQQDYQQDWQQAASPENLSHQDSQYDGEDEDEEQRVDFEHDTRRFEDYLQLCYTGLHSSEERADSAEPEQQDQQDQQDQQGGSLQDQQQEPHSPCSAALSSTSISWDPDQHPFIKDPCPDENSCSWSADDPPRFSGSSVEPKEATKSRDESSHSWLPSSKDHSSYSPSSSRDGKANSNRDNTSNKEDQFYPERKIAVTQKIFQAGTIKRIRIPEAYQVDKTRRILPGIQPPPPPQSAPSTRCRGETITPSIRASQAAPGLRGRRRDRLVREIGDVGRTDLTRRTVRTRPRTERLLASFERMVPVPSLRPHAAGTVAAAPLTPITTRPSTRADSDVHRLLSGSALIDSVSRTSSSYRYGSASSSEPSASGTGSPSPSGPSASGPSASGPTHYVDTLEECSEVLRTDSVPVRTGTDCGADDYCYETLADVTDCDEDWVVPVTWCTWSREGSLPQSTPPPPAPAMGEESAAEQSRARIARYKEERRRQLEAQFGPREAGALARHGGGATSSDEGAVGAGAGAGASSPRRPTAARTPVASRRTASRRAAAPDEGPSSSSSSPGRAPAVRTTRASRLRAAAGAACTTPPSAASPVSPLAGAARAAPGTAPASPSPLGLGHLTPSPSPSAGPPPPPLLLGSSARHNGVDRLSPRKSLSLSASPSEKDKSHKRKSNLNRAHTEEAVDSGLRVNNETPHIQFTI
ncbi:MLX-interacting protein [Frankliniella fusca]|uniref:MLX-interacting protein n=1 Tax=Frankliniella fusca TaxID=407009 RepID=A0AAE1H649_9NEOP|nr:MLX-interacting protein [Frankliniella fusca]